MIFHSTNGHLGYDPLRHGMMDQHSPHVFLVNPGKGVTYSPCFLCMVQNGSPKNLSEYWFKKENIKWVTSGSFRVWNSFHLTKPGSRTPVLVLPSGTYRTLEDDLHLSDRNTGTYMNHGVRQLLHEWIIKQLFVLIYLYNSMGQNGL